VPGNPTSSKKSLSLSAMLGCYLLEIAMQILLRVRIKGVLDNQRSQHHGLTTSAKM
jgi:hypothetical protein